MTHAARLRQIADTGNVTLFPLLARDLRRAADRIDELEADNAASALLIADQAFRVGQLEADLERTRQAWVDGDEPMCEDVCMVACKGPCGATP